MQIERIFLPENHTYRRINRQLIRRYVIENGEWVWHPDDDETTPALCRYSINFCALPGSNSLRFHLTADQYFMLFIDGERIAHGPETSDINHWAFVSFEASGLASEHETSEHEIEVFVWWAGDAAPCPRITFRKGFLLKAEGDYDALLSTGSGAWTVQRHDGFQCLGRPHPSLASQPFEDTQITVAPWHAFREAKPIPIGSAIGNGLRRRMEDHGQSWRLIPARLPELHRQTWQGGEIRAVLESTERPFTIPAEALDHPQRIPWNRLIHQEAELTISARTSVTVLWDLDDYVCGYAQLQVIGGEGTRITWTWDESLFTTLTDSFHTCRKGNRDEIVGKAFRGCGDHFVLDGGAHDLEPLWWRCGRYCAIQVETSAEPLTLKRVQIMETRYPIEAEGSFSAPISDLRAIVQMCLRSLQTCAHDIYVDCPYYEQRMYTGDACIEALIEYVTHRDDRLAMRSIELFNYSRAFHADGMVTGRYPARTHCNLATFSLIWVWMVHDHYYWRDHEAFTRTQLVGVRAVLNALDAFRNEYGLIADLPGFQFVDWAMGGEPPGAMEGLSCTINLHYLLTLDCAIDLEEHLGEPHLAALYRSRRETVISALRRVFWSAQRGCFADDADHAHFSEHCLSLSVRSGILDEQERTSTAAQLQSADDLIVCELYYSHYLFDAYHRLGLGDAILERLADWRRSLAMGLKTTPERYPEDARSDCHAWSAHPLFHFFTSIAGIRPAAPGFASVLVSPTPGSLPHLTAKMPHPQGYIAVDLHFSGNHCKGSIDLTAPISGRFCWQGCEQELKQGLNNVDITSTDR